MKKINYPLFNVSSTDWNLNNIEDFWIYEDIFRSSNESFMDEYLIGQKFTDYDGNLFTIVDKVPFEVKHFFFFKRKNFKLIIKDLNSKISFEEVQEVFFSRLGKGEGTEFITKAKSIGELIDGST